MRYYPFVLCLRWAYGSEYPSSTSMAAELGQSKHMLFGYISLRPTRHPGSAVSMDGSCRAVYPMPSVCLPSETYRDVVLHAKRK